MKLIVSHGAKKYSVDVDKDDTLEQLKLAIFKASAIIPSRQKLLAGGSQLKNNEKAKLAQFGMIKDGTKLMVIEMPDPKSNIPPRTTSLPSPNENGQTDKMETILIQKIQTAVDKAANVLPNIDFFEEEIKGARQVSLVGHKTLEQYYIEEHARIIEALLQILLELDNVVCEPEQETARIQRKSAVKLLQSYMDRADSVKQQALKSIPGKM
jgi:hypothetical protein